MASVVAAQDDLDREQAGELELELVAVRYTGRQTMWGVEEHLTQAGWPGGAALDGGPEPESNGSWNLALMPDDGLAHIEGRPDLEIVYADQRQEFAHILLEQSDLPENVFGRAADLELQERVFDLLGLKRTAQGGPFEDQLRDLAYPDEGEDEEPEEPEASDEERSTAATLADEYTRHELGDICKVLRADPSEFNLQQNATKTERAEFVATFDRTERAEAVEEAIDDGE